MGFPAKVREKRAARRDTRPQSVWPPLLVKRFVFCVNATSTNGVGLVTHFYKGVGVGTFLHPHDLRISGITPAKPTANFDLAAVTQHVSRGVIMSPCISVTRSYAGAEDYARNAATSPPTRVAPAYVYVIDVPDAVRTGITMCDPVEYVASRNRNPSASPSYHHNGSRRFLLALVDPILHQPLLTTPPVRPPGMTGGAPAGPSVTPELETMVCALRDAEALVIGSVPRQWIIERFDIC